MIALFFHPLSLFADKVDYVFETESVSSLGDAADDPAIWFNQANPTKSLIFGTDKRKGIHVYDLYGKELSFSELGATNNIDLRVIDENVHMVISNRSSSTLGYWVFPESNLFKYFSDHPTDAFTEDITHYHLEANMNVCGEEGFVIGPDIEDKPVPGMGLMAGTSKTDSEGIDFSNYSIPGALTLIFPEDENSGRGK